MAKTISEIAGINGGLNTYKRRDLSGLKLSTKALTSRGGRLACENLGVRKLYMCVEDYRELRTEAREGKHEKRQLPRGPKNTSGEVTKDYLPGFLSKQAPGV